ncbi:hypothetical protein CONPUDRAFT_73484 [Coniophora puteana RWD-64-598 SS2]|uniref:Uncharacterized protein n=1 Tax=Coniophora puteana (strain RWD-64-598) TaxID=741705 RepID=A0A5M3MMT0_CONPW|nr:uncharacterized protein CONPUDRAFT_73484 [Coniophora puteana RWD-64-598 SS2]EIW80337.1 hypothetical protein CONPUDRAFT_73484 [Coniophora puteana RWD-64-598 SS2]
MATFRSPRCNSRRPASLRPLDVHIIESNAEYHGLSQGPGKKKLTRMEIEMIRLSALRHPNLLSMLAVNKRRAALLGVLQNSECLREERVSAGVNTRGIFLATRENQLQLKRVKLDKVKGHAPLRDQPHHSNLFGPDVKVANGELGLPEACSYKVPRALLMRPGNVRLFLPLFIRIYVAQLQDAVPRGLVRFKRFPLRSEVVDWAVWLVFYLGTTGDEYGRNLLT